ncbi:serine-rich adhesin for platelets-like [Macrosteles quadrilineatus]|uniref:serine-rich adhesin for platelets-like n=1 Tax=Macrosteles quadrilineatus TaxID=74068 RepID=UPI0023E16C5B|nr:serine-rich adhesin for platelets-like [Macrosteles quadrilineatus]
MSLYSRNYGSWSSKSPGSTATDKAPASSLDRSSRYGSTNLKTSGSTSSTSTSSYRPLTATSVRDRAAQLDTSPTSDKPSIREKYASRSYGVDSILRKSPEPKPEAKVSTSTFKRYGSGYSPTSETPTLRFGSTSRFGGQIARSPITEKSPTVFGVSGYSRTRDSKDEKEEKSETPTEMMTVITRGTSPTPPSNSTFLRARRAEMDRTIEKTIPKLKPRHTKYDVECQTDEKCIEDAKLESKLSAASALTSRTPSPSSSYSRFSSVNTKYTPRTSAYHGTRPTELSLKSMSVNKATNQEDAKTEESPKDEKIKRLEGKDTTRIGGFSYARPTDLPMALNKAMADTDKGDGLVSPSKIRSISPQAPKSPRSSLSGDDINKSFKSTLNRASSLDRSNEDTSKHSIKGEVHSPSIATIPKIPLSPSISSVKLTSPDRTKLPPPSPKVESIKTLPNKDFRKSELNMNLSSSNESLNSQKLKSQNGLERSPSTKSPVKLQTSKSLAKLPSNSPSPKLVASPNQLKPTFLTTIKKTDTTESSSDESSSTGSSSETESESSESENDEPCSRSSDF